MVMLKSFQRLGYFPHPENVPITIIKHIRSYLKLRDWVRAIPIATLNLLKSPPKSAKLSQQVTINQDGEPVLKRLKSSPEPKEVEQLEEKIRSLMPERSVLDILCNVEHWLNWTRHFGPLSGSESKLKQSAERYIFTTFGYGCNLGPNQTARHSRGVVTSHMQ